MQHYIWRRVKVIDSIQTWRAPYQFSQCLNSTLMRRLERVLQPDGKHGLLNLRCFSPPVASQIRNASELYCFTKLEPEFVKFFSIFLTVERTMITRQLKTNSQHIFNHKRIKGMKFAVFNRQLRMQRKPLISFILV